VRRVQAHVVLALHRQGGTDSLSFLWGKCGQWVYV